MSHPLHKVLILVICGAAVAFPWKALTAAESQFSFFIRDGDRVAIAGDSITEPGESYATIIEAYTLARFPKWRVAFWNLGSGGDTASLIKRQTEVPMGEIRNATGKAQRELAEKAVRAGWERDLIPLEPTVVLINFGMNDGGWGKMNEAAYAAFLACQEATVDLLKGKEMRVVLATPKPVEKPDKDLASLDGNVSLKQLSAGLQDISQKKNTAFVDIFTPLLDLMVKARSADPQSSITGGDGVHPAFKGHLLMAWAVLKGLGAPALVSSAEIDFPSARVGTLQGCTVTDLKVQDGGLSFKRLDESLPLPLRLDVDCSIDQPPVLDEVSRYELKVTGLGAAKYQIHIDGEKAAEVSREQLQAGLNLTGLPGPIARQMDGLWKAILTKNQYQRDRRRTLLQTSSDAGSESAREDRLKALDKQIEQAYERIDAAREIKAHVFEIRPVS